MAFTQDAAAILDNPTFELMIALYRAASRESIPPLSSFI
jgi:hypothetical protein